MNAEERQRLRGLVEELRRAELRGERPGVCVGCGCAWSQWVKGCSSCQRRHFARRFYGRNGHLGLGPR